MKGFTISKIATSCNLLKMNYFIGIILLMLTVIFIYISKFKNSYLQGKKFSVAASSDSKIHL